MEIVEISVGNFEELIALWQAAAGVGLDRDSDTKERIATYLRRNPGLSFAAWDGGRIVGAVLCGHDGRRGYMHHLAVAEAWRGRGIGRALVEKAISRLQMMGVRKCNIFLYADNTGGYGFWRRMGWIERTDSKVMSKDIIL